jgi:ribokinase
MPLHIISIIGSLNTDLVTTTPRVPSGGETLTASSFSTGPGGKGANQAVACARLTRHKPSITVSGLPSASPSEVKVQMIGAVGSDEFGPRLISRLEKDGIETSRIHVIDGQTTGVAVILVEELNGENRILLSPGANYNLQPEDFNIVKSLGVDKPELVILQLEIPLETVFSIIRTAKKAGIAVLLNPAPAVELPTEVLEDIDHLIVNESEAAILSGQDSASFNELDMDWGLVTDEFLRKGVKNVVVTLGSKGAYASKKIGGGVMVEATKVVKAVDTTAAGDTFVGAYAVEAVRGHVDEWDMEGAVKWACRAAGRTVEKKGAQSAIPWASEVEDYSL